MPRDNEPASQRTRLTRDAHGWSGAPADLVADGSLPHAWAARWGNARSPRAVWTAENGWLTYGQLEDLSAAAARRMAGAGVGPGDRVLMSCAPSLELIVAHVGALRLGVTVVPMNTAYTADEIASITLDAEVSLAVLDDPVRASSLEAQAPHVPTVTPDLPFESSRSITLDASARDDVALICYTSGTTGRSKGAMLTHGNLLAGAEALRFAWRWSDEDVLVSALPLFHVHGLCNGLHGTLLAGGSVVVLPRFEPREVIQAVRDHEASMFFGVPTMYSRLVRCDGVEALRSLRLAVSGSAPLPESLFEQIAASIGQRPLERYGMTETLMNVSNPYEGQRRPGTVGFPLPGVEVELTDATNEIRVRGPNVFIGYWRNSTATEEAFDSDRWFATGDVGAFDDGGYLKIVGRLKELIITGGLNVYPREVEEVLTKHPAVQAAAVVGAPSDEWGETVVGFVVASSPVSEADLISFVRARIAGYKCPRRIWSVESLPLNAMGKVQRATLQREAAALISRSP